MKGCVAYTALLFLVPCMGQNMVSLDSGNFNASWTFNETSDTFEFLVDVRATGWVGFGFSLNPPPGMMNYDVAVGGVLSNGSAYLQDYYTRGQSRPIPEQSQDFMLINATEQNQVTTLAFSRKRNTTDPEDIAIQRGMPVYLVWAYNRSSDAFLKHDVKGVQPGVVILPSLQTTPLPTQPTTPAPKMFQRNISFDGGNFNVYWSYNSTSDRLYFTLDVAATGWVGFGFSENMPSAMNGYDVVVGGVRNGDMYLKDYLTQGFGFPPEDQRQNVDLMYATERDGRTMISYSRKRDTNDADDIAIAIGEMYYLVWAYHSNDDGTVKHQQEGFAKMVVIPADAQPTTPAPKMFQRNISFDGGNFNVYWSYNSTSDRLYFALDVAATGWVGFGFSENMPSAMNGYDVVVGGVRNGDMYLKDYLTQGFGFPPEDQQQNVDLMYATERDGRTMISYSRKRDTNDADDIAIAIGEMYYLVWAYHSTDDGTVKHQQEGFAKMVVIPADDAVSTTDGVGPGVGVEQGGEMDQDEKETDLLLTITILLAVTLGLIVVSLFLVALGLAYFKSLMQRVAVAK